ncbi:putative serine/threonine-protein kinase PBL16, partial [Cucurbita argyrosperma subsp. argyrosperma]
MRTKNKNALADSYDGDDDGINPTTPHHYHQEEEEEEEEVLLTLCSFPFVLFISHQEQIAVSLFFFASVSRHFLSSSSSISGLLSLILGRWWVVEELEFLGFFVHQFGFDSMGNCWYRWEPTANRVSSNAKSESPKVDSTWPYQGDNGHKLELPSNPKEVEDLRRNSATNPLIAFTFDELKLITGKFRQDRVLGGGGFGSVYKGFITEDLREGIVSLPVAVKVHDGFNSYQGHREWLAEVIFLGQLSHPNLVKLIGYCCEDEHRVLVYDMLCSHSMTAGVLLPLPWTIRMKIAYGAAKGLAFLHEAEKPVIYRDFKTSNILLDSDYNPKLSDFGLAKDGPVGDKSHVSTRIMGTYGYAAPEHEFFLCLYLLKKKLMNIVDPRLGGEYPVKGFHKAAMLAYHCLNKNPKARPLMRDIVDSLEPLLEPSDEVIVASSLPAGDGTGRMEN